MSQVNQFKEANNPDRVYYDILLNNIGREKDIPARFLDTTDIPIVNNTGDYNMSVVRFQIDTPNLPVLIIQPSNDPTAVAFGELAQMGYLPTAYNVFFSAYGMNTSNTTPADREYVFAFQIDWKPENPNVYKPSFNEYKDGKHINFEYFYCYSYSYFFDFIVSQSLKYNYGIFLDAYYDQFVGATANASLFNNQISNWTYPPTFAWDKASAKVNITAPPCFISTDNSLTGYFPFPSLCFPIIIGNGNGVSNSYFPFSLGFSPNFYTLISTFPALIDKFFNVPIYNLIFRTNFVDDNWIKVELPTAPFTSYNYTIINNISPDNPPLNIMTYRNFLVKATQEWSSIDLMSPINSIVFTSNTLPLILNQQSSQKVKPKGEAEDVGANDSSKTQQVLMITDLQTNQQGYRPNLIYVPSAEYRYITLTGNQSLYNIDINVYYQLKTGELIPFKLTNGGTASIKLLFEKKILAENQKIQQLTNLGMRDLKL